MSTVMVSFGYLHGDPPPAEVVVDLRQRMRDPHHDPAMRELTGADQAIVARVKNAPGAPQILGSLAMVAHAMTTGGVPVTIADRPARVARRGVGGFEGPPTPNPRPGNDVKERTVAERLAETLLYEAWQEFRYPRASTDEPTIGFRRAVRVVLERLEAHYRDAGHSPVRGDFERLSAQITEIGRTSRDTSTSCGNGDEHCGQKGGTARCVGCSG